MPSSPNLLGQDRSGAPACAGGAGGAAGWPLDLSCARDCPAQRETHHRITNQLTMLAGYLRLKLAEFEGENTIDRAAMSAFGQSIDAQLGAVARLHRLLMSDGLGGAVDLYPLLHEICASFEAASEGNGVLFEDLAKDCRVAADQVLPIGQLVAEAIVNARKHALRGLWNGFLIVRSTRTLFGGVKVEVIDNGPGLPEHFDPERDGGFGFNLMRGIARGLDAPLLFDSSPRGLRISLILPEERAA